MIKTSQGDMLIDSHIAGEEDEREKCVISENFNSVFLTALPLALY